MQSCRGWHRAWRTSVTGGHAVSSGCAVLDSGPFVACTALCNPVCSPPSLSRHCQCFLWPWALWLCPTAAWGSSSPRASPWALTARGCLLPVFWLQRRLQYLPEPQRSILSSPDPIPAFLLQPPAPPCSFVILGTGRSGHWGSSCSSTRRDLKAVCMFSRLCRMDVSLFLQSVATSSVASASVIP